MSKIQSVKITEVKKHPDATKLHICTVQNLTESFQVVCGAKNVDLNMITILAQVGSTLPSGKIIQEAKLRGIESFGMLCSPIDLEISNERGIIHLPPETKEGVSFKDFSSHQLSSTPWFNYKFVELHYEKNKKLHRTKKRLNSGDFTPILESYWDGEKYLYRKF